MLVKWIAILAALWAGSVQAEMLGGDQAVEVPFNGNSNFEGLSRLRVSYEPAHEHTRDLMQVEMK